MLDDDGLDELLLPSLKSDDDDDELLELPDDVELSDVEIDDVELDDIDESLNSVPGGLSHTLTVIVISWFSSLPSCGGI